ncbi:hypothetical protein C8R43DRAFT_1131478 [Mycena crocata]|nr:hypothetical protein C8R43DRAFT_1131478 [Mycena crocata]
MSEALTPQQRGARTRARNKAREEEEAREIIKSSKAWLAGQPASLKRVVPDSEASQSGRGKIAKKNNSQPVSSTLKSNSGEVNPVIMSASLYSTGRALPPDIDGSESEDESRPRKVPAARPSKAKAKGGKKADPPKQPPRTLQKPIALAKTVDREADEESHSDDNSGGSPRSADYQDEQEEDDPDPRQLRAEAPTWAADAYNSGGDDHSMHVDTNAYNDSRYYNDVGDSENPSHQHSTRSSHSRSGSVSSGYDLHVPSSPSERHSVVGDGEDHLSHADELGDNWSQAPPRRRLTLDFYDEEESQVPPVHRRTSQDSEDEEHLQVLPQRRRLTHFRPPAVQSEEEDNLDAAPSARQQKKYTDIQHPQKQIQLHGRISSPPRPSAPYQEQRRDEGRHPGQHSGHREHQPEPRHSSKVPPHHQTSHTHPSRDLRVANTGLTKRKEKAAREEPVWVGGDVADVAAGHPDVQTRRSQTRQRKAEVALPSPSWPYTPTLIFTTRGVLNLNDQAPPIQAILRGTFTKVIGDSLFVNGFADVGDRLQYACDGLYSVARKLGYVEICKRLKKDTVYSRELAKVADARWTDVRRHFKHTAIPATIHSFDLKVGCSERVQTILASPHTDYIYPIKDNVVDYTKPFCNPAIITTIHQAVFLGRRPISSTYQDRIPLTDGAKPERMIGKVIAAIAATAVCATLQEWQGPQHVSNEFNANLFAETYLMHINFLEQMREQSPVAYQNVLTRLYREASGQGKVVARRATTGANVIAHLDFAALEAGLDS